MRLDNMPQLLNTLLCGIQQRGTEAALLGNMNLANRPDSICKMRPYPKPRQDAATTV
jgi:hypothetical protein